jgi:hypothetical protein
VQHVDGDQHAVCPGRPGDVRQLLAGHPGERVWGADEQGPAGADGREVDVSAGEQPGRARDVEGGPLAVRPDGQDRGRGLGFSPADQPGGVDAVPGHGGDHDVAEQVVADGAAGEYPGPQLGQVDGGPGGRTRGGGPDLPQPDAALTGRYRLDRPPQHVQDVRAEHGHCSQRPFAPLWFAHGRRLRRSP